MILCENAVSVFFVKAQVARKRVILHKSFFFSKIMLGHVLGTNGNVSFAKFYNEYWFIQKWQV